MPPIHFNFNKACKIIYLHYLNHYRGLNKPFIRKVPQYHLKLFKNPHPSEFHMNELTKLNSNIWNCIFNLVRFPLHFGRAASEWSRDKSVSNKHNNWFIKNENTEKLAEMKRNKMNEWMSECKNESSEYVCIIFMFTYSYVHIQLNRRCLLNFIQSLSFCLWHITFFFAHITSTWLPAPGKKV